MAAVARGENVEITARSMNASVWDLVSCRSAASVADEARRRWMQIEMDLVECRGCGRGGRIQAATTRAADARSLQFRPTIDGNVLGVGESGCGIGTRKVRPGRDRVADRHKGTSPRYPYGGCRQVFSRKVRNVDETPCNRHRPGS